jgi:hypothetical protein
MFEVLLTILVLFFIFRLVSGWIVRYLLRRHAKRTGQSPFEEQPAAGKDKKKVIKKEVGEYVDFEEVKPNNPPD